MTPIQHFDNDFSRLDQLETLHTFLTTHTTGVIDTSDMLRAEYVLVVSALDHYVHSLTLAKLLDIFAGRRPRTPGFEKFLIPTSLAIQLSNPPAGIRAESLFEQEVRTRHSFLSFQHPDKIADAIRLVSEVRLWDELSTSFTISARALKEQLINIVDRRNKIAHESDKKPGFPGELWPIDRQMVTETKAFVKQLCYALDTLIS
ncbi:MAG: HEPN domain-containing protein [Burkholderiaceae bacterium]